KCVVGVPDDHCKEQRRNEKRKEGPLDIRIPMLSQIESQFPKRGATCGYRQPRVLQLARGVESEERSAVFLRCRDRLVGPRPSSAEARVSYFAHLSRRSRFAYLLGGGLRGEREGV